MTSIKLIAATILGAALLASAGAASATTVDFDTFTGTVLGPDHCVSTPISSGGLTFTTGFYQCVIGPGQNQPGKADNGTNAYEQGFTATTVTGPGSFKILSLDIGQGFYSGDNEPVDISLNLVGGGVQTFHVTSTDSFQTINFGGIDVTAIEVGALPSGGYFVLDNINYSAIPEPATWALMVVAMGGLGATLRRRKAYRLVEIAADGKQMSEEFRAEDDRHAITRAFDVASGAVVELWRGNRLVARREDRALSA